LPFNLDGISRDSDRADGNFDGAGLTMAGEQWPAELAIDGVTFKLGSSERGARNMLVPGGETLPLSGAKTSRFYVLEAAVGGDVPATFSFDRAGAAGRSGNLPVIVREWQAPVGQWYSTIKTERMLRQVIVPEMPGVDRARDRR
jgi:hypothetical protein